MFQVVLFICIIGICLILQIQFRGGTNGSINEAFMKNMANSVCSYSKHNAGYSSDVLKR